MFQAYYTCPAKVWDHHFSRKPWTQRIFSILISLHSEECIKAHIFIYIYSKINSLIKAVRRENKFTYAKTIQSSLSSLCFPTSELPGSWTHGVFRLLLQLHHVNITGHLYVIITCMPIICFYILNIQKLYRCHFLIFHLENYALLFPMHTEILFITNSCSFKMNFYQRDLKISEYIFCLMY